MQRQSKQILARQRSAQDVEASVTLNGPEIGRKLDERFGKIATEGEAPRPSHRDVLFTLRDDLAASRRKMVVLDNDHVENLRRHLETRSERDELLSRLYDHLGISRRTIEDLFKPKSAFVLAAIEGPTSPNSDTLVKQANIAINRLKSPDMALPEARFKGVKVDPETLAEELEADVGQLRDKNTELRQARRKVQHSRKRKNRAIEEHDQTFLWTARTLEGYYQLAGEEDLAKEIRPSTHRPGRRAAEVAEGSDDGDSAGAKSDGDATSEPSEGVTPEPASPQAATADSTAVADGTAVADDAAVDSTAVADDAADSEPASQTPES